MTTCAVQRSTLFLALLALAGCENKKQPTTGATTNPTVTVDAEAQALLPLETRQELPECRTALLQLDNFPSAATRPVLAESERGAIAKLLQLTPGETAEIAQSNFSQSDAQHLDECLLVRAGVRSLRIDARTPLERAQLAFAWVCRMVYIDDRMPFPAPPWMTLHCGSGVALARAYLVIAAWQQLGLDACLIGPADMAKQHSYKVNPLNPEGPGIYAAARACGVLADGKIYLFDPGKGQPLEAADGKTPLTLTEVRAKPELVKTAPSDEAKEWQIYVAPNLSAVSRRMQWLQQYNPGNSGVRLFVDVLPMCDRLAAAGGGAPCAGWNPPGDEFSATRIMSRYAGEETTRGGVALRDQHRVRMIPLEHMPRTNLAGTALAHLSMSFGRPFESLRYAANSPRDYMIRGQFQEATTGLEETKRTVDNARTRIEQDKDLQRDFEGWADKFRGFSAELIKAQERNPAALPAAARALDAFRNEPRNRDIERAFVLGNAARPLGAEIAYMIAECVHERAERAQRSTPGAAKTQWKNAVEWWGRFLDASAQARSPFPAREAHARQLLQHCERLAGQ